MRLLRALVGIVCFLSSLLQAQSVTYHVNGASQTIEAAKLSDRIFAAEQKTIAVFAKSYPIVETYLQSLNPEAKPEVVLDDAYFLRRVSLDPESPRGDIHQSFAFGSTLTSQSIKWNNGTRNWLFPGGYIWMLFPDLIAFDSDHYKLTFEEISRTGQAEYLQIAVSPIDLKRTGQFEGRIWIETTGFHIVRLEGNFTPRRPGIVGKYLNLSGFSNIGIYFHFECVRQEVSPGVWLPTYSYFDDKKHWKQTILETGYHFRGYSWVWGYRGMESTSGSIAIDATPVTMLEKAGLIASPGPAERWLDEMLNEIRQSASIATPAVHCRILMTTPPELFSDGDTVVVSRGLLNLVPDQSVLGVLLSRELARSMLHSEQSHIRRAKPIFPERHSSEFPGFGFAQDTKSAAATEDLLKQLLNHSAYADAIPATNQFLSTVASRSSGLPNLLRAHFGLGLVEKNRKGKASSHGKANTLLLRSAYSVDSAQNQISILIPKDLVSEPESVKPTVQADSAKTLSDRSSMDR